MKYVSITVLVACGGKANLNFILYSDGCFNP